MYSLSLLHHNIQEFLPLTSYLSYFRRASVGIGRHYLSFATCPILIWPHCFYVCIYLFFVSSPGSSWLATRFATFEKPCVRQVVLTSIHIYIYIHIEREGYIYIYIYIQRERERGRTVRTLWSWAQSFGTLSVWLVKGWQVRWTNTSSCVSRWRPIWAEAGV